MELGFWLQSLVVFRIPWAVLRIHTQKFPRLQNPDSLTRSDMVIKLLFAGQTVKSIYAVYDQNAGDRRWNIHCVYNKAAQICKWSSYYHTSFKYECQGFISGKYNPITYECAMWKWWVSSFTYKKSVRPRIQARKKSPCWSLLSRKWMSMDWAIAH